MDDHPRYNPYPHHDPYHHYHQNPNQNPDPNYPNYYSHYKEEPLTVVHPTFTVPPTVVPSTVVHPTFFVHPTTVEPPSFIGHTSSSSVNPSSVPFLHVRHHNGIQSHAGPYPNIVNPYKFRKRGVTLVYNKIKFPFGFYKLKDDGTDFIPVSTTKKFRVLISVIDDCVLGILNHHYVYFGLYAKLVDGNFHRVTKPPGDVVVAELMLQPEREYLIDLRQFQPNSRERIY